jgi:hypothetical protein
MNAASLAYNHIDTNAGGAPSGASDLLANTAITVGNTNYYLTWTVADYWHAASTVPPVTSASTAGVLEDEKLVTINVEWLSEQGISEAIALNTVIDSYSPSFTALSGKISPGGEGPKVGYTPLAAPDVVPVTLDIGGKKKESSKPVPDLSKKGYSTVVEFQAVTYTTDASTADSIAVRKEEFLTALCRCGTGSTPDTNYIWKGGFEWDDENKLLLDIAVSTPVSTIYGTDVNDGGGDAQDPICIICCRDSADVTGSDFKSCRMKRVDGIYRLYDPWQMIAFNIIPSSYFNTGTGASGEVSTNSVSGMTTMTQESNISLYSDYSISVVRNALSSIVVTSAVPASIDNSFDAYSTVNNYVNGAIDHKSFTMGEANNRELQVRALYIDIPLSDIYEGGLYTPTGVSAVPLDRIPFYENNFTQIVGWVPDVNVGENGGTTGDITLGNDYTENHDYVNSSCENPDHDTSAERTALARNHVTNEKFFYQGGGSTTECLDASRGEFYPIVAGVSTVVDSAMWDGNAGVVDFIDPLPAVSVVPAASDAIILSVP